jgi:hypothetical protein
MAYRKRSRGQDQVPSSLEEWLQKWEPKLPSFNKRRGTQTSGRASAALDELEFLLSRTVENQVSE